MSFTSYRLLDSPMSAHQVRADPFIDREVVEPANRMGLST
jgi:hypothetical protein